MTAKTTSRGLGRGLAALLGDAPTQANAVEGGLRQVPIDLIDPNPNQPRSHIEMEPLEDLAESIRQQGILQPLLLRTNPTDRARFQIVAGERRWRAAALAGLHQIPAVCKDMTDRQSAIAALVENLQREDLNAMEKAESLHRLDQEFGLTLDALADAIGKSRPYVGNFLRLLKLPESIQELVRKDLLTYGHARALVGHPDADALAAQIIERGLSVRQTEMLVMRQPKQVNGRSPRPLQPDVEALTNSIGRETGYQVKIQTNSRGGGALTIKFTNAMQLEELIEKIRGGVVAHAAD